MKPSGHVEPPSWVGKFLKLLLDEEIAESVLGDITEKFVSRTERGNKRLATFFYILEGVSLVRLIGYSKMQQHPVRSNLIEMFGSYFLVAYRNLKKEKLYSFISVIGMAIGLSSVIVIYTYIRFEVSYDRFHEHHERIYRITSEFDEDGKRIRSARALTEMHALLSQNVAGIENVTRILPQSGLVTADGKTKFREDNFCFTDSSFFSTFTFRFIAGSPAHALHAPSSVVVTEKAANRYFGQTDVIGRQLIFEDEEMPLIFTVTGVIADFPQNSHFVTDFIASFSSLSKLPYYDDGNYPPLYVYLKTEEVTLLKSVSAKIQAAIARHLPDLAREQNRKYFVQRLEDIHLNSNLDSEWQPNARHFYIQAFAALGLFVQFIACINFINLATAQGIKRGREIGVRKVFGGLKIQLILQFLTETCVQVIIAFAVSICLAELGLRFFLGEIIEKDLSLLSLLNVSSVIIAAGFIVAVSFLAGIYPSVYLSHLKPSAVLKGVPLMQGRNYLRKTLVIFQVIISCLLITGTIIILRQVEYFETRDLGFDKEQVMSISLTDRYAQSNYAVLSERLLRESVVISTGLSSTLPGRNNFYGFDILPEGSDQNQTVNIKTLGVDEGFVNTYNLRLIDGRGFSKEIQADQTEAFIINEAAAEKLGWENPVGKELELTVYIRGAQKRRGKVIGMVKDFHFESLHHRVEPLLLYINKHPYYAENLSVRLKLGQLSDNVEKIQKIWNEFHPDRPMEYSFVDETLQRLYQTETRLSRILAAIAIIALAISALGIFSLSSYMASRRAREMGIRKVFGASSIGLLIIQYREYLLLIILANAFTIPVCIYWARQWLSTFAYHTTLDASIFIATLGGSVMITLLIITFHTFRVATANPVAMIRNE